VAIFATGFFVFEGTPMTIEKKRNWKPATQLVHSGTLRSQFG
jgi:O-succinylhomoserine sulfhydrylase